MRNFGDSVVGGIFGAVLQVLWACRLFYESLFAGIYSENIPANNNNNNNEKTPSPPTKREDFCTGKRHLIRFFSTPNVVMENGDRPIYQMHVSELMSPIEEEMLRHACAKGSHKDDPKIDKLKRRTFPPTGVWTDFTTTFTG